MRPAPDTGCHQPGCSPHHPWWHHLPPPEGRHTHPFNTALTEALSTRTGAFIAGITTPVRTPGIDIETDLSWIDGPSQTQLAAHLPPMRRRHPDSTYEIPLPLPGRTLTWRLAYNRWLTLPLLACLHDPASNTGRGLPPTSPAAYLDWVNHADISVYPPDLISTWASVLPADAGVRNSLLHDEREIRFHVSRLSARVQLLRAATTS